MDYSNSKLYICKLCNKEYSCRQNLWKHNQKYHINNNSKVSQEVVVSQPKVSQEIKQYKCKYCEKTYMHKQSKYKHEKKCKNDLIEENNKLKEIIKIKEEKYEKELTEIKQQLLTIMNKNCKVHPKTLQKINNQLNANNSNINSTVNSNNTVNYNIIALGHEDLTEVFSKKEKLTILKNKRMCLDYIIKYTHFNDKFQRSAVAFKQSLKDAPQFKNIMITNTQNDLAYKYDKNENKFVAISKDELLNNLMDPRMSDITLFYEELDDELDEKTKKIIDKFLEQMDDDKFKDTKKKDIKIIIYNNRDKVSKDLEIIV